MRFRLVPTSSTLVTYFAPYLLILNSAVSEGKSRGQ